MIIRQLVGFIFLSMLATLAVFGAAVVALDVFYNHERTIVGAGSLTLVSAVIGAWHHGLPIGEWIVNRIKNNQREFRIFLAGYVAWITLILLGAWVVEPFGIYVSDDEAWRIAKAAIVPPPTALLLIILYRWATKNNSATN